jgi:N-succinyldiaminopimelate aminotransferase
MPIPTQLTSVALWNDENHVLANRDLYREKYQSVVSILNPVWPVQSPEASFYLWPETPIADDVFAVKAFSEQNVTLLPGRYLGRQANTGADHGSATGETDINPGENHVRMALVATVAECSEAAERLKNLINSL